MSEDTLTLFTKEAFSPYNKNEVFTVSKADGEKIIEKAGDKVERYNEKKHAEYLPTSPEDLERQEREARTHNVSISGAAAPDTSKADDLHRQLDEANAARDAAEARAAELEAQQKAQQEAKKQAKPQQ